MIVKNYIKKPQIFQAVKYTGNNIEELMEWCSMLYEDNGLLILGPTWPFKHAEDPEIKIGDYIVKYEKGFVGVFSEEEFQNIFKEEI